MINQVFIDEASCGRRRDASGRRSNAQTPCLRLTWVPVVVQLVHVLGLIDPVHVAAQVLLHLLLLPQLLEVSAGLGLLSLLTELSATPSNNRPLSEGQAAAPQTRRRQRLSSAAEPDLLASRRQIESYFKLRDPKLDPIFHSTQIWELVVSAGGSAFRRETRTNAPTLLGHERPRAHGHARARNKHPAEPETTTDDRSEGRRDREAQTLSEAGMDPAGPGFC